MANEILTVEIDPQGIGTVTFDKPPVNAMDADCYRLFGEAFRGLAKHEGLKAVILASANERAWIAGRDINEFLAMTQEAAHERAPVVRECFWSVYECPVPTIAAVNGPALGAGLLMSSMCDLVVASERAVFGLPEINVGSLGGAKHLARLVPQHMVRKMMLTGERVTATRLQQLGFVDKVVPDGHVAKAARDLAGEIAEKSPVAIRMAKEVLNKIEFMDLYPGYAIEQEYTARLMGYEDPKEAARAFLERRKPVFTGR